MHHVGCHGCNFAELSVDHRLPTTLAHTLVVVLTGSYRALQATSRLIMTQWQTQKGRSCPTFDYLTVGDGRLKVIGFWQDHFARTIFAE
jgi:hypothetical protein